MARNYRVLLPNGLTFLSLLSGTGAILVAAATPTAADAPSYLLAAGLLVLASYLIDGCDGALARFNLQPPKATSHTDSVGLTISTGGALLVLAVLSNLAGAVAPSPVLYLCVTVGVSLLMVSTIAFPSLGWIFAGWRPTVVVLGLMGLSLVGLSFFTAWLVWTSAYVGMTLVRAGARRVRRYTPGM